MTLGSASSVSDRRKRRFSIINAEKNRAFWVAEKKKSPQLGGLRRILPAVFFFSPIFYYSPSHIHHEAPQQHTAGSAGLLRAAHPTPNTHTARARRVTGANVGSSGISTELSQHETQISNITYYNNCCPPVIPPFIFQTTECCRKAHFRGAILSPFFLSIAEKRFLTSSPVR